jgi:hypothetical protein
LWAQCRERFIFFWHGWNNDFADAVDLYCRFLTELEKVLTAHPVAGLHPIWPFLCRR